MPLSRWMALIGLVVGLGCLRVTQHHAVVFKGYAVGDRASRVHAQHNEVAWLNARIAGLASPAHLGEVAQQRHLKFIARSTLQARPVPSNLQRDPGFVLADGDTAD